MDESGARQWLIDQLGVSRETLERLQDFVNLLREENERQNLVSRASLDQVWSRHIVDSAQLLRFAPAATETWLDLGTGAGFPGLIVGLLRPGSVVLVAGDAVDSAQGPKCQVGTGSGRIFMAGCVPAGAQYHRR